MDTTDFAGACPTPAMDESATSPDPVASAATVLAQADVHEVRYFGAFAVLAPDGAPATPPGRKARALLAGVLLAPGCELSREHLAGLLWSQRGEDQARASLRQTLYELRPLTAGGAPLLRLDRAHVRLAHSSVRSDLGRLRDLSGTSDAPLLAALVGDQPLPLLRDFDGIDPAFDEWLAVERVQRHDERRQIMLNVGLAALAAAPDTPAGDADTAGAAAARQLAAALLAADPFDEAAARLAMRAAHRLGDRDGVRVAYRRLESALRQGLGAAPSTETQTLCEHLMAAPVRALTADAIVAVAPLSLPVPPAPLPPAGPPVPPVPRPTHGPPDPPAPAVPTASSPAEDVPSRPSSRTSAGRPAAPRAVVAGAALALLLGVAAWQGWRNFGSAAPRVLRVDALKVAATDSPAQALRLGLAAELARLIVGNDAVLSVADASEGAGAPGAAGDAEIVVTGQAQSSGGLLHAQLSLIARDGGAILWSNSFTGPQSAIEALREQMAAKLADVAVCAIGGGRNPTLATLGTETMRLYLAACEQKHGDWALSAKLLKQVVARQPEFAHAWAMLAAATAVSAAQFPDASGAALQREATREAERALALDRNDGEAYFGKAMAMPGLSRWQARQAVLEAGHAVEPGNAQLNSALASNMAEVGRWQEAIVYGQRALECDPFSPGKASELAKLLAFGGDVLDARLLLREHRRRFPQNEWAARTELLIEAFVGDARRALQLLSDAQGRVDMTALREAMWRTLIAARQEPSAEFRKVAADAVIRSGGEAVQSRVGMVVRLAALSRIDQAFEVAETLKQSQTDLSDWSLLFWDIASPLRADPRFMRLAARHGLATVWLGTDRWPDFCADRSLGYDCRTEAAKAAKAVDADAKAMRQQLPVAKSTG